MTGTHWPGYFVVRTTGDELATGNEFKVVLPTEFPDTQPRGGSEWFTVNGRHIMIYHISTLNGVKPTQNWGAPTSGIWINGQLRAIRVSLEMGYKIEGSQPAGRSWWTVCQMAPSILPKSFMCKFLKEISGALFLEDHLWLGFPSSTISRETCSLKGHYFSGKINFQGCKTYFPGSKLRLPRASIPISWVSPRLGSFNNCLHGRLQFVQSNFLAGWVHPHPHIN